MTKAALASAITILLLSPGQARADSASAYYHKAMAQKRDGNIDGAIKSLTTALEKREDYAAAHYSLGILQRRKGNHSRSIYHLERASQLDTRNGDIYYSLGLAYYKAGRKNDAFWALQRAAKLSPDNSQIVGQLGVLMIRRDPLKAIGLLKKAVKLAPTNADHHHQLGLAYRQSTGKMTGPGNDAKRAKQLKAAEKHLLKAASMKQSAAIQFDLGVVYRRMEKPEKAIRHYEEAIRLDNDLAAAYWDVGHMYAQEKRHDEAIQSFEAYLRLKGSSADAKIARKRIQELKKKSK